MIEPGEPDHQPFNDGPASSTIAKAFAILRLLRRTPEPMSLGAVAKQIGIAPSSTHSILGHLVAQGAVIQHPDKRYGLGPQLFYLGAGFAANSPVYRSLWEELVHAANELSVIAAVAIEWENHHLVLNAHSGGSPSDIAVPTGGRIPLDASSWGKVYYAWSGAPLPDRLTRYTSRTMTDLDVFRTAVEAARTRGYAVDVGEFFDGVGGVCAPVTSSRGYEGLASFVAPLDEVERTGIDNFGRRIAHLTARASVRLGADDRVRVFGSQ